MTDTRAQADLPAEVQEALALVDGHLRYDIAKTIRAHIADLARQLAEAQHELAAAAEDIDEYQRNLDAEVATRLSAERRLAEVEKDAARLDWMESEMHALMWDGDGNRTCIEAAYGRVGVGDSWRAAIDAAIAQGDKA